MSIVVCDIKIVIGSCPTYGFNSRAINSMSPRLFRHATSVEMSRFRRA